MKNQEAKFILGAYRPDGRDAGDATFAPALAQAEQDPALRAWFESQRKFDAAVAAKLQEIAAPPGLREGILAGSRVSAARGQRRWWRNPFILAAAAAIVVVAAVGVSTWRRAPLPTAPELVAFAQRDLADAHADHDGDPPGLAHVQAELATSRIPLTKAINLDLGELRKNRCRAVRIGGREVFEICFERDGAWYHVYVGRRSDFAPGAFDPQALMNVRAELAATGWADANHVYALVTDAGAEALRRVI